MIERTDINSVLMQMRALKADAQQGIGHVGKPSSLTLDSVRPVENEGFGDLLKNAIDKVNDTQMEASRMATAFEQGDPRVELTQVMIQLQKASVSFQAMTQVRNKLVAAYEDVMKMPI
ncbi:flagellar hook-basal body complex protein FliE [Neptunomonas qingdaonensis]|uniref:Flagellar hook-basal body complex protein FliE n=1 Tax=Neptunomonas qingdaonensis TaxID=1045558 RepID=A0A1I2MZW4_9GAMM|nr:flagellar hook-basal body complex protein FliE [Neptunomonas qingdaonensis]SFF97134.1 flagellar hook-basal body complex protein FliE [Neptunomonas qingdaonensis]